MRSLKTLFIMMLTLSIIFTACNKNTSLTEEKQIDPTEQKILDFKEKMNSGDKSGETMTVEEAVWNIEATLNYTYNDFEATEFISVDTVRVPINISASGEINFNDVVAAYIELENNLTNFVGEYSLCLADVEIIESANKSEGDELTMTTVVNSKFSLPFTFGTTDYWKAFWGGKCGAYSGYTDRNARTELSRKANYTRSYPANGYITDINTVEFVPYENPDYQDYLFYQSGDNNIIPFEQECLNPDELNYWLVQFKQLAIDYRPDDKEIAGYYMNWTGYNIPDESYYYTHFAEISYGIFHYEGHSEL
jgi:hypothetical protein